MSSIVTFYSYKGGVGRSMALANTAVLLARQGKRVLVVDWDLEAPGLERYFSYFKIDMQGKGLLNLLIDSGAGKAPDYRDYLWTVREGKTEFSFLASGKDVDPDYSAKLEAFDWQEFFHSGGGDTIEAWRDAWKADYDIVLVDSRTGLSDSGGVCTIQLPDIIVGMFTPNHQSLYGVRDVIKLAQSARQSLAYDRAKLSVVPLASRFGGVTEFRESREWVERTAEVMADFYADWTPTWVAPIQVVDKLKLPQVDYFGFGEKLAVVEQGVDDPAGLGFIYDCLARLLANDLQDAESVLALKQLPESSSQARTMAANGFEYDFYISYDQTSRTEEWVRECIDILTESLKERLGREVHGFLDYREVLRGHERTPRQEAALRGSRLLLMFVTNRYLADKQWLSEFREFNKREKSSRESLIFPVFLESQPIPEYPAIAPTDRRVDRFALPPDAPRRLAIAENPTRLLWEHNPHDFTDYLEWGLGAVNAKRRISARGYGAIDRLATAMSVVLSPGPGTLGSRRAAAV